MATSAASRDYGENVAYDLSRFDSRRRVREALAAEPVAIPADLSRTVAKPKAKVKAKSAVSFFAVISYLAIFALLLSTVTYYMRLNELSVETAALQAELESLTNDAAKLRIEYERTTNLREIDSRAAELGLYTPGVDQIVYIDITQPDRTIVFADDSSTGFLDGIAGIFLAVVDFFE